MTPILISCMLLTSVASTSVATASSWSSAQYATFDHDRFAQSPAANEPIDVQDIDFPLLHAAVFYETNRQRIAQGLRRFRHSPALERAARRHSVDMVAHSFFAHEGPVAGKETLVKRLERAGVRNAYAAENIATAFGIAYESGRPVYPSVRNGGTFSYEPGGAPIPPHTYVGLARAVVRRWMQSPGHRRNILQPKSSYLGVGAAHFRDATFHDIDKFKLTQCFASVKGTK